MRQLPLFTIVAALLLAGCAAPRRSHIWETVKAARQPRPIEQDPAVSDAHSTGALMRGPGGTLGEPAPTYVEKLHKTLQSAGVEHKIVTFKFRYRSRLLLNREGEETAVVYRDSATPAHPWWLMSERLFSPVWLPAKQLQSQVAFYLSRPATVVKVEVFPAEAAKHAGNKGVVETLKHRR